MGVYHFAGLGRSIGAVTAAFSYLAARKQLPDAADDPLFAESGQADLAPEFRGAVQAIVLFSTKEVLDGTFTGVYVDNRPGYADTGPRRSGSVMATLKSVLQPELAPLARRERLPVDEPGRPTGPRKPVELYLCEVDPTHPVQAFERAAQTMRAAKPPGQIGHEIWINLTGGTNIINSALQLAASLTGAAGRQYYLLSDNTDCNRHTVPTERLGSPYDSFWVDVPITYLDFNPQHVAILTLLAELGPLSESELGAITGLVTEEDDAVQRKVQQDTLRHTYLRPLAAQRLVVHKKQADGRNVYQIGEAGTRAERYFAAMNLADEADVPQSLGALARAETWLQQEELTMV